MTLGQFVRQQRIERGLSLCALARLVDIAPPTLSALELRNIPVGEDKLRRIAHELKQDVETLLILADHVPDDLRVALAMNAGLRKTIREISTIS